MPADEYALELDGVEAPPTTPRKLNVRFNSVRPNGRVAPSVITVEDLPPHCTVRDVQLLMYDHLSVSIRQPIELRYWGKTLELDRMLKDYAIKEHSELTVVVKPKLPYGTPCGSTEIRRLRFSSHNLKASIAVEGVNNDMSIFDVKSLLQARLKAVPVYLAIVNAPEDERTGTMAIQVGDQFQLDNPGSNPKGKGLFKVRRVRDDEIGLVNESDVALLTLQPDQVCFYDYTSPLR